MTEIKSDPDSIMSVDERKLAFESRKFSIDMMMQDLRMREKENGEFYSAKMRTLFGSNAGGTIAALTFISKIFDKDKFDGSIKYLLIFACVSFACGMMISVLSTLRAFRITDEGIEYQMKRICEFPRIGNEKFFLDKSQDEIDELRTKRPEYMLNYDKYILRYPIASSLFLAIGIVSFTLALTAIKLP